MKPRLLGWMMVALMWPMLLTAQGLERELTDQKGRKITAVVLDVDGSDVRLRKDGKEFSLPLATLSEADQLAIRDWVANRPVTLPYEMRHRVSPEARAVILQKRGGAPEIEESVNRGLQWLVQKQESSGLWDDVGRGRGHGGAMTGLVLLALQGQGHGPESALHGDAYQQAVEALIGLGKKNNGTLAENMDKHLPYEHGIACYALADGLPFQPKNEAHRETLLRGLEIILDGQTDMGGWLYNYATEGNSSVDICIGGWQCLALATAQYHKVEGLDSGMRKARMLLEAVQGDRGGFPYRGNPNSSNEDKWSLTGAGVFGLQAMGSTKTKTMEKGIAYLFNPGPNDKSLPKEKTEAGSFAFNPYANFFHANACSRAGDEAWAQWREQSEQPILNTQSDNGSWGDSVYTTALQLLALQSHYRHFFD